MANTEFDEQVLNEYESRMNLLNNLKRKYGKDITELIGYQSKLANEIDKIENYEQSTSQLREEIKTLYNEVIDIGKKLSQERRRVARELRDHIVSEIQNLQMKDANLEISFKPLDEPTIEGIEFVEFLISPNRGEPLKSLNKIYLLNHVAKQRFFLMKLTRVYLVKQHKKWLKKCEILLNTFKLFVFHTYLR